MSKEEFYPPSTYRGLEGRPENTYPGVLGFDSESDFIDWIRGKVVLDLGSGYGGVVQEIKKRGYKDCDKIISVDSGLSDPTIIRDSIQEMSQEYLGSSHQKDVENSVKDYLSKAVAARWASWENDPSGSGKKIVWHLPFQDESVDRIMSSFAFPFYALDQKEAVLAAKDLLRILKKGGEMRLGPMREGSEESWSLLQAAIGSGATIDFVANKDGLSDCVIIRK